MESAFKREAEIVLDVVPYSRLQKVFSDSAENGEEQKYCNTYFHTADELPDVIPDYARITPDACEPWLYLHPWLPLILSSQRMATADVHEILLLPSFLAVVMFAGASGVITGHINGSNLEDLESNFPKTTTDGTDLSMLFSGRNWFARLDTCSLKDAKYFPTGQRKVSLGSEPVVSSLDIYTRLATSSRGLEGVRAMRASGNPVKVFLFPWREDVIKSTEYRIFCPPVAASSNAIPRIAAISQYKWHEPWQPTNSKHPHAEAEVIFQGCNDILSSILHRSNEIGMFEMLKHRGFVFDVFVVGRKGSDDEIEVQLIELNNYGAMSGCGSALFHWIRDAALLYGLEDKVEFIVSMDEDASGSRKADWRTKCRGREGPLR